MTISIQLGEQRVFHAALPGTSADNDSWVDRKSRVVRRFACSSLEVHERYAKDDPDGFFSAFALSPSQYAPAGGAVPIRVRGTLVGVLAVSGLESSRGPRTRRLGPQRGEGPDHLEPPARLASAGPHDAPSSAVLLPPDALLCDRPQRPHQRLDQRMAAPRRNEHVDVADRRRAVDRPQRGPGEGVTRS